MSTLLPDELDAMKLMLPLIKDVAAWISGDVDEEPPVLALLPDELRSEASLRRLEARAQKAGDG